MYKLYSWQCGVLSSSGVRPAAGLIDFPGDPPKQIRNSL